MESIPVLLPGKPQGQRSLAGYSPWGRKESDTTERLLFPFSFLVISVILLVCWNAFRGSQFSKDLLQLQCSTCLNILLFPFLLLRSLIWLFKFNLALRSRFQLLVQGLNLSDLFNLLLSLPFLGSYDCIYPVLLCAVICRRTKQFSYNLWKYPVFFSCRKK